MQGFRERVQRTQQMVEGIFHRPVGSAPVDLSVISAIVPPSASSLSERIQQGSTGENPDKKKFVDEIRGKIPRLTEIERDELQRWTKERIDGVIQELLPHTRRRSESEGDEQEIPESNATNGKQLSDLNVIAIPRVVVYVGHFLVVSGNRELKDIAAIPEQETFNPHLQTVLYALNYTSNLLGLCHKEGEAIYWRAHRKAVPREKLARYHLGWLLEQRETKVRKDINTFEKTVLFDPTDKEEK